MIAFSFFLSVLFVIITGYLLFSLIIAKSNVFYMFEIIAISFGLGNGFISLWMFLISLLRINFSLASLLLPTLLCLLFFLKLNKGYIGGIKNVFSAKLSTVEIILICFIVFNLALVFINALSLPFIGWDEWCNWGFKSRLFFEDGFVSVGTLNEYAVNIPRLDQPLNLYLILCYVYEFLGNASEEYSRAYLSLFYPALLSILYYALRKKVRRTDSFIVTYLVSSLPIIMRFSSMAYGDIAFSFYLLSAVIYLYSYHETCKRDFLLMGTLLLGMCLWTKSEGNLLWLSLFSVFLFYALHKVLIRKNSEINLKLFLGLILSLIYILPWKIFVRINKLESQHLVSSNLNLIFTEFVDRFQLTLRFIFREMFNISEWNIFWVLFFATVIYLFKAKRKKLLFLSLFFIQFLFYTLIYLIWPQDITTLGSVFYATFPRLLLQIAPIAAVFIGWQLGEVNDTQ